MAKRTTTFELVLPARKAGATAQRWLYATLRAEILEGRLRPGARLPGTRDLGRQYGLARGTVVSAYEQLKAEGYVEGSVGSGTHVSGVLPEAALPLAQGRATGAVGTRRRRRLSGYGRRSKPFSLLEVRPSRAFRPNLPALDLFPISTWAQATARVLRRASTSLLLACPAMGYEPLQHAIADYLNTSRGVKCDPGQVAIVSGVQEALDLTARLVLDPGDRVCMEDPGYEGAALVFEAAGARISRAPIDAEGMVLRESSLRRARLVYVTPAHQFPLGTTMSLGRRLALLEWARTSGALVFEDDYDGEYRYATRPIPALHGLDRAGCVLFAGSFNKVLFPSLRLGYLVVPKDLAPRFAAMRSATCRHPPLIDQAVLCDFMRDGHLGRHLRRMRGVYAERLSALLDGAREMLGGLLEVSSVEAGLQTAAWLPRGVSAAAVAEAAALRAVEVTPLSQDARGRRGREGLVLGFSAVDVPEIRRGVRELRRVLEKMV